MKFQWRLSLSTIAFCLVIAGCAPNTSIQGPELSNEQKAQAELNALINKANSKKEPEASKIRAEAALGLIENFRYAEAFTLINQIDLGIISTDQRFDLGTFYINESINRGSPENALLQIRNIFLLDAETLNNQQKLTLLNSKLSATEMLNRPFEAIQTRIEIGQVQGSTEEIQITHDDIWLALTKIDPTLVAAQLRSGNNSYYEQGWYELYNALSSNKQLDTQYQAFGNWRQLWNQHPANILPPSLLAKLDQQTLNIEKIAVLLPFEGKLSKAATAIKEGILIAHYRQQRPGVQLPQLLFLDSTKINSAGLLAPIIADEQVDLIIGPLNKKFVSDLINSNNIATPILALNYSEDEYREGIYQFGLSVTGEARQVAEKAWQDGKKKVAILTPNTNWGERVRNGFTTEFKSLGGQITSSASFSDSQDFSARVTQLLNTETSTQRYKQLRQSINTRKIEFEEHRRTDIDAIILSALPNDARQLSPILAFNFAGNLPIYSTSHVYAGTPDPVLDQDLNKIRFLGMPWSLKPPSENKIFLSQERDNTNSRLGRLYALGIDAYRIHPYLKQLSAIPGTEISGETGTLSLNQIGQVERKLLWARYKDGTPLLTDE